MHGHRYGNRTVAQHIGTMCDERVSPVGEESVHDRSGRVLGSLIDRHSGEPKTIRHFHDITVRVANDRKHACLGSKLQKTGQAIATVNRAEKSARMDLFNDGRG